MARMNHQDLQTLVDYHYWARDRLLEAVAPLSLERFTRDLGNSFPSIRDTAAHLVGADWIWCARWDGESPEGLPGSAEIAARFPTLDAVRDAWTEQERKVRAALARYGEDGIDRLVEYTRNGRRHAEPFSQTLQHLVNHGSYHRGQVTTMLRQLGATPPKSLDLIAFYRERVDVAS